MKGIYMIHDKINNKNYIGQTKNFKRRFKEHRCELKRNVHSVKELQDVYNKYGMDALEIVILVEDDMLTNTDLDVLEIKYIKEFNTFKDGYNHTLGGKGLRGLTISPENREAINKGIREKAKRGKDHFRYGTRLTEEQKRRCREKQQGHKGNRAKLTLTEGIQIKLLAIRDKESYVEIAKKFNVSAATASRIANGKRWANLPNDIEKLENMLISSQASESHKSN